MKNLENQANNSPKITRDFKNLILSVLALGRNSFIILLFNFCVFSQSTLKILDSKSQIPIYFAQIFSKNNDLIGISDINGVVNIKFEKDSILKIKHLEYKTKIIDFRSNVYKIKSDIYLESNYQNLDMVQVVPFSSGNFYDLLLEKSADRLPREDFYGSLVYSIYFYHVLNDIYSAKDAIKIDTSVVKYELEINFQYIFDRHKNPKKLFVNLKKGTKTFYLLNDSLSSNDYYYLHTLNHFFDVDFYDITKFEKFNKRKGYKLKHLNDSISYFQISKELEDESFMIDIAYANDSVVKSFKSKTTKIRNNNIAFINEKKVNYDVFDVDSLRSIFYLKQYNRNFTGPTLGCINNIVVTNINFGILPELKNVELSDFEQNLKNLPTKFEKYQYGMLPKKYYDLFRNN